LPTQAELHAKLSETVDQIKTNMTELRKDV